MDTAGAAEIYAKRQQLGEEAISYAHAVKIEALAQLGQMLLSMKKNKGAKGSKGKQFTGSLVEPVKDTTPTLAELKIDKKTFMVAQQLAGMPEDIRTAIAEMVTFFLPHQVEQNNSDLTRQ